MDLVINGDDALLLDKVFLYRDRSTTKTCWGNNGGAACLSTNPDHGCWIRTNDAEYARLGVSFNMDGSTTTIPNPSS